jgi:hypothetical protein
MENERNAAQTYRFNNPGTPVFELDAAKVSRPGFPARQTHDDRRNGTTTLFAALNALSGNVLQHCQPHHTHVELIEFLKHIDRLRLRSFDAGDGRSSPSANSAYTGFYTTEAMMALPSAATHIFRLSCSAIA